MAQVLKMFPRDYGIQQGAQEFIENKAEFMKTIKSYDIELHVSEPHCPQQNPAEGIIREIRRRWF
jgi:hypothetical protein